MCAAPDRIRIVPDEFHIEFAGRTCGNQQFFATHAFAGELQYPAVYLWQSDGTFYDALIGEAEPLEVDHTSQLRSLLTPFSPFEICPIDVAPFQVNRFGHTFGLVAKPPEPGRESWTVCAEPGNYLVFVGPWDGGYDT